MKKKLLTAMAALVLVLGVGSTTSCDGNNDATLYTISDLLVYDRFTEQFDLTGQKVSLENVIVTSSHGNSITVSEYDGVTAIEVILADNSPEVTIETLVNVTGTMNTYHGRAQIIDATVETVDTDQQNFYYTTGFTRAAGFDNYGRLDSGVIGGASQKTDGTLSPIKLRLISYNGVKEYKEGEDIILTVAYQGTDYDDPYNWLELVLFGDSDQATIAYYNAFFFGTDTAVSWSSPFSTGRADRSIIPAGWTGIAEGEYFACTLLHFFYDEELNPDYGSMFFLDNVCLQYIDSFELYDEESDLGNDLARFETAFNEGKDVSYTNTITYSYKEGETITLEEYYSMNSAAYNRYLNNLETIDSDTFTVKATQNYFAWEEIYYSDLTDEDSLSYQGEVLYTYTDSDGLTTTAQLDFDDQTTFKAFLESGTLTSYTDYITYNYDGYVWTDLVYSLFDLFSYYNYSRSFHQTNTSYTLNDDALIDYLWDVLDAFFMGYSDDYYDYYGYAFDLNSLTYNSNTNTLKSNYDLGGWYYADTYYTSVLYLDYVVDNVLVLDFGTEAE
ncbi:MAG: hypothetical protein LUD22_00600 [Coprobacillus sp.]|nr:hypothetical protein [Coprobacillus sp.]